MAKLGNFDPPFWISESIPDQKIQITLVDETDIATPETGVSSPTIQLSKNGAAWASASDGTWAEVGNGIYTLQFNGTDTDSPGWLAVRVIKSSVSAEAHVTGYVGVSPTDMRASYMRLRTLHRTGK